jgi:beta-aspartyl-peptidase (threonine type)
MPLPDNRWSVIVHGGARSIPERQRRDCADGCFEAAAVAATILSCGGSALDAVEGATRILENAPQFNAGYGSVANADGDIEMDAAIMDGETLALGGVGAIRNVRHPVMVARALLAERPTLLVGEGANRFAEQLGAEPALTGPAAVLSAHECGVGDTVGCVARDRLGHFAAAGSTGGIAGKMVGRVGDTPLPGCGLYADDECGAVALSGDGESIARGMLAAETLRGVPMLMPGAAIAAALRRLDRIGGQAGAILIDREGRMGIGHNTAQFSVAVAANWMSGPQAATHASELKEWLN